MREWVAYLILSLLLVGLVGIVYFAIRFVREFPFFTAMLAMIPIGGLVFLALTADPPGNCKAQNRYLTDEEFVAMAAREMGVDVGKILRHVIVRKNDFLERMFSTQRVIVFLSRAAEPGGYQVNCHGSDNPEACRGRYKYANALFYFDMCGNQLRNALRYPAVHPEVVLEGAPDGIEFIRG